MSPLLQEILAAFEGVEDVEIEECEIDEEDGGVFPAVISVQFSPDTTGFHALEFLTWAFGDIGRAVANVHYQTRSPPPWLNTPGQSLSFSAYVNPRSTDATEDDQIAEVREELDAIASFLRDSKRDYWELCRANV